MSERPFASHPGYCGTCWSCHQSIGPSDCVRCIREHEEPGKWRYHDPINQQPEVYVNGPMTIEDEDDQQSKATPVWRVTYGPASSTTYFWLGDVRMAEADVLAALNQHATDQAALDVTEAFAQQVALKQVNGGPFVVVWGGDYDSISDKDLRQLVGNFLVALDALRTKQGRS